MKLSPAQIQSLKNYETFAELTDIADVRHEDLFVTHDNFAFDVNELADWLSTKKEFINPYTNDELPVNDIAGYCAQLDESVAGHLQRAQQALHAGDTQLARTTAKAALKLQPNNPAVISLLQSLGESATPPSHHATTLQLEQPNHASRPGANTPPPTNFPPPPRGWHVPTAARRSGLSHAVWFGLHQLAETMTGDLTEDHSGAYQALHQWNRTMSASGDRRMQARIDQHIKIFDLPFAEQIRCALSGRANSARRRIGIMDFGRQLTAQMRQLGFTVEPR